MKTFTKTTRRSVTSLLVGGLVALTAPASALDLTNGLFSDDAFAKKPSAVTITNKANGEVGCHDNVNQVSRPGPCPTKDPGQ